MTSAHTRRLLGRVARRLHLARLGAALHRGGLIAAGVATLALLAARLLALLPAEAVVRWLWLPAALAVVAALAFSRKPSPRDAARLIDERAGAKELFLTTALLSDSSAPFSPIVIEQAEQRATSLDPRRIVPFAWRRGARDLLLSAALVAALAAWLPQLDPLKRNAQRERLAQQQRQLERTKAATALRAEQLAQASAKENDKVRQALAALERTFKEARPQERDTNLRRLGEHQKELGELWRQAAGQRRNDAQEQGAQKFGQAANPQQAQQWREDLNRGDASAVRREIEAIKAQMQELARMPHSAERHAQQEQLAQRLSQLSEGLKQAASSPELQAALQRAMEQLETSKTSPMSREALEAARQSLSLSEQEIEQLVQVMKNQQALEAALRNVQMARQLAEQQRLDGSQCQDCNGMTDYESLYKKLCQSSDARPGTGPDSSGPGGGEKTGQGDKIENATRQELSPTQLSAGKILLQWKTQELGPAGARPEQYEEAIRQVKQGVSEAIAAEQVPPGYHGAIQKYFDSLPAK